MSEITRTPAAEMWFEKADRYYEDTPNITLDNVLGLIPFYGNAIKNTSSDEERAEMKERISESYANYANKNLKKLLNDTLERNDLELEEDYIGFFYKYLGDLFVNSGKLIWEQCGVLTFITAKYPKLFTKTVSNFLKSGHAKVERIKNKDTNYYVLKTLAILFYTRGIYDVLNGIETEFGANSNVKCDFSNMKAAWWEVFNELSDILSSVQNTACKINPTKESFYRNQIEKNSNELLNDILSANKIFYDDVKKAERKKYFEEHPEELEKLKAEIASLEKEMGTLNNELNEVNKTITAKREEVTAKKNAEAQDYQSQIQKLEEEMCGLGLFSFSAKGALKDKIRNLQNTKANLDSKYNAIELDTLKPFNTQIDTINAKKKVLKTRLDDLKKQLV